MTPLVAMLAAWVASASLVTAAVYAYDKLAAPRGRRRIRERTLWFLCAAGGVPGAWLVFFGMRHKTRHRSFWLVQAAATIAWIGVLAAAVAH